MAIILQRAVYTDQIVQSPSVNVPATGLAYTVQCDMFNFSSPAQGIRIVIEESVDGGANWTLAAAAPATQGEYIEGGIDSRTGSMKQPAVRNLTGVKNRDLRVRLDVRGAIDMRVNGTVQT
jgi:hypothetical protein